MSRVYEQLLGDVPDVYVEYKIPDNLNMVKNDMLQRRKPVFGFLCKFVMTRLSVAV